MKQNSELRDEAVTHLREKWGMAAVATLIVCVVQASVSYSYYFGALLYFLVVLPLTWGRNILFLDTYRGKDINLDTLLAGFRDYARILGTTVLVYLYIFLWSLLFLIPGIIKAYSYAMTTYILKDYPELQHNAAIEKSMAMMNGHRMKLFLLDLSFIGWAILCLLTLGLGVLLLVPYVQTSHAAFYEDLKAELTKESVG